MHHDQTDSSRRQFLNTSLRTSAALLAGVTAIQTRIATAQNDAASQIPGNGNGEDYWRLVRGQFSFAETAVPMNAANLCPSFRAVAENVEWLTADIDRDCSFNNRAKFSPLLEEARGSVAAQLNVSADEIALVRNTSEANNIINNGLDLEAGDEVLLWDQNHPTNNVAWEVRAARYGIRLRRVSTPAQPAGPGELLDAFTSQFTDRTRVLALTHVSNVSGVRLPVAELAEAAHARGIHVHVDGAQTWGAMALDLRAMGADSFTASAHKWYMGPKEVGLLYVRRDRIDAIWPSVIAPGWGDGADTSLEGARKFESLGQRDDAALAGLGVTAAIHDEIGPVRIENRVRELSQRLKEGITDLGLNLVTPMDPALSLGVVITEAPEGRGGEISNRLYTEYGIAGASTGGIRLCPTIYNTNAHIDRAIDGLRALLT
ncbi:MAG: aminotransferase class V-fold PLP-dependent enzyme [Pseudohongiellaceae bacterium]